MVLIHSVSLLKQVVVPHVRRLAERYVTILALSPEGQTRQLRLSHLGVASLGLLGALVLGLAAWGLLGQLQVRSQQFHLASLQEENRLLLTQRGVRRGGMWHGWDSAMGDLGGSYWKTKRKARVGSLHILGLTSGWAPGYMDRARSSRSRRREVATSGRAEDLVIEGAGSSREGVRGKMVSPARRDKAIAAPQL